MYTTNESKLLAWCSSLGASSEMVTRSVIAKLFLWDSFPQTSYDENELIYHDMNHFSNTNYRKAFRSWWITASQKHCLAKNFTYFDFLLARIVLYFFPYERTWNFKVDQILGTQVYANVSHIYGPDAPLLLTKPGDIAINQDIGIPFPCDDRNCYKIPILRER